MEQIGRGVLRTICLMKKFGKVLGGGGYWIEFCATSVRDGRFSNVLGRREKCSVGNSLTTVFEDFFFFERLSRL